MALGLRAKYSLLFNVRAIIGRISGSDVIMNFPALAYLAICIQGPIKASRALQPSIGNQMKED